MLPGLFNPNFECVICGRLHAIRQCTRFQVMGVEQKLRVVARYGLCTNCLAQSHRSVRCRSIDRCKICLQDHNTWLHPLPEGRLWFQMTAQVRVITFPGNRPQETRVLIDPNAARSSIMSSEAERLNCDVRAGRTTLTIYHRRLEKERLKVKCYVEERVYTHSPIHRVDREDCRHHVQTRQEADKWWYEKRRYFLILGADVAKMLFRGPAIGRPGQILRQETVLGDAYFGVGKKVLHDPRLEE